uniref:Calicivirus coat protein domain-containing protein n=1 Tax=Picornavirales sp. TaxID=1955153 RepID=A0A6M3YP56_9VIRU|nr:MAG: hypothetical protein 3 [Picornavirales sp.]
MSQAHIPQPSSQSAAPAEVFDSTADAPHGASVSALGTAGPKAGEVSSHSGQKNSFDFSIHRQFIPTDTFLWSTAATRGTLLWSTPIHPSRANPLIAYLSGMYNTWGGSIEYNFKVAGTGFHAGALAFVRIPPNKDPKHYNNPSSWGAFEYVVMDPKTLEVMSVDVIDQRPLMFHYMNFDPKDPMTFGGYLACYVLIPLNTSSTGSQTIAVQVFDRPGTTFTLNQLIIPTAEVLENPQPAMIGQALNVYSDTLTVRTRGPASAFFCGKKAEGVFTYRLTRMDGSPHGMWADMPVSGALIQYNPWRVIDAKIGEKKYVLRATYGSSMVLPTKRASFTTLESTSTETQSLGMIEQSFTYYRIPNGDHYNLEVRADLNQTMLQVPDIVSWAPKNNYGTIKAVGVMDPTPETTFTPIKGEVILYHSNLNETRPDFQTIELADLAQRGYFKHLFSDGGSLLFTMVERNSGVAVGSMKLGGDGVMTVHDSYEGKTIPIETDFFFDSYVTSDQPIPFSAEQYMNNMIMTASTKSSSITEV